MAQLIVDVHLSAERFLAVYQGRANRVLAKSRDGRKVSLRAQHLRPFLTHDGVQGSFVLEYDEQSGALLSLKRLDAEC